MSKNFIKVMLFIIIFCNGCECPNVDKRKSNEYSNVDERKSNEDYNNDAKIFWEKIFEQDQHTMDYIIKWLRENPDIKEIYISHPENKVCFLDDKESMFDVDKCVTNFIKKNDIYLCVESDNIIFTHEFWKGDINGEYRLLYIEYDDNVDENYFKLRHNYYYDVCFYGE